MAPDPSTKCAVQGYGRVAGLSARASAGTGVGWLGASSVATTSQSAGSGMSGAPSESKDKDNTTLVLLRSPGFSTHKPAAVSSAVVIAKRNALGSAAAGARESCANVRSASTRA